MEHAIMRHRPYGGVTSPNASETIEMIANCTGCKSTDLASGSSTVPTITMAGMASRKQPTTRKQNAMKKPAAIGPMPQVETLASSASGILYYASNQPKALAVPTQNS